MLVVSDTSPLNYLVLIEAVDLLPVLFDDVFVPPVVIDEMRHQRAPMEVRDWATNPPAWLKIRAPGHVQAIPGLHRGETEAIALVEELGADALLVDERDATKVAERRGILVIATLAVLARAALRGLIDVDDVSERLRQTNFRGPIEILGKLVEELRGSSSGEG